MWRAIEADDKADLIIDKPFSLKCPHCGAFSNITAVSTPRWKQVKRYDLKSVIVGFRCDACSASIALRFRAAPQGTDGIVLSGEYEELERPMETFDYQHLPQAVASDFREALTSYSHSCLNATAAMCRRTIQSVATNLGASGTDKVSKQLNEAKELGTIEDEDYEGLREIMLGGHDGSHPHLPAVSMGRAAVLVEIMKDILYQLYVRKGKIDEAKKLRQEAIDDKRAEKKP